MRTASPPQRAGGDRVRRPRHGALYAAFPAIAPRRGKMIAPPSRRDGRGTRAAAAAAEMKEEEESHNNNKSSSVSSLSPSRPPNSPPQLLDTARRRSRRRGEGDSGQDDNTEGASTP